MNVGDKIKFTFAGQSRDAVVHKVFTNTVYLKVDFDRDKGKIVKRKLNAIQPGKAKPAKKKDTKKEKK